MLQLYHFDIAEVLTMLVFFFYVSSCVIHNFTSDLLAYSQNSAYRKAWFKTKLLFKEKIGQI